MTHKPGTPNAQLPQPAPELPQSAPSEKSAPFHKRHKRALLVALAALVIVAAACALFLGNGETAPLGASQRYLDHLISWVDKHVGTAPFFAAYALMPVVGFSLWFFNFAAGVLMVDRIGMGWTLLLAAICITIANALSYWLARDALRPLAAKLVAWLGYKMPDLPPDEHVSATIVMRIVPGIPYIGQSYVLGLANVRFAPYMVVSFIIRFGWAVATIMLGKSYRVVTEGGSFKAIVGAAVLLVLLLIGTRWARKYYAKKPKAGQGA